MKTIYTVALLASFSTLLIGQLSLHSQPPDNQQQAKRPIQIVQLSPNEKAKSVSPDTTISARFDFLRGTRPIIPPSLRLVIDGSDVTQQARIAASDDIPSSRGEISFKPTQPFSTGKHTAQVRFANDNNQQSSYTWEFYVR